MIYLASPYTHPDEDVLTERVRIAAACAARIIAKTGKAVFCPVAHAHILIGSACAVPSCIDAGKKLSSKDFDWVAWDLQILEKCDELRILMLKGWRESKGIKREIEKAEEEGIPITVTTLEYPEDAHSLAQWFIRNDVPTAHDWIMLGQAMQRAEDFGKTKQGKFDSAVINFAECVAQAIDASKDLYEICTVLENYEHAVLGVGGSKEAREAVAKLKAAMGESNE